MERTPILCEATFGLGGVLQHELIHDYSVPQDCIVRVQLQRGHNKSRIGSELLVVSPGHYSASVVSNPPRTAAAVYAYVASWHGCQSDEGWMKTEGDNFIPVLFPWEKGMGQDEWAADHMRQWTMEHVPKPARVVACATTASTKHKNVDGCSPVVVGGPECRWGLVDVGCKDLEQHWRHACETWITAAASWTNPLRPEGASVCGKAIREGVMGKKRPFSVIPLACIVGGGTLTFNETLQERYEHGHSSAAEVAPPTVGRTALPFFGRLRLCKADLENPDLIVKAFCTEEVGCDASADGKGSFTMHLCLQLSQDQDTIERRRVKKGAHTALRADIAAAMVRQAGPFRPGDIVFDPMTGTSTIPAEAVDIGAAHGEACKGEALATGAGTASGRRWGGPVYGLGSEIVMERLSDGLQQERHVDLLLADSGALPLRTGSIDAIITDLPYGIRCGSPASLGTIYQRFAAEAVRVLRMGGRCVVLGQGKKVRMNICLHPQLLLREVILVDNNKVPVQMFVMERAGDVVSMPRDIATQLIRQQAGQEGRRLKQQYRDERAAKRVAKGERASAQPR